MAKDVSSHVLEKLALLEERVTRMQLTLGKIQLTKKDQNVPITKQTRALRERV